MIAHLLILAQEAAPAAPAGGEGAPAGGGLGMFVPMILIMVMFYSKHYLLIFAISIAFFLFDTGTRFDLCIALIPII